MDGTLVDNTEAHLRAFARLCEQYHVYDWQERIKEVYGMGNEDIMRHVLPEALVNEKGIDALAEEKEGYYREIYAPEIAPIAGLHALLERLQEAGIRCAVGSSGPKVNVDFVIEKCQIAKYLSARISGDMVTRCKPDSEIYLKAAAALGVSPSECLIFEDARAGIESAARAGAAKIIALSTTLSHEEIREHGKADIIIDTFEELSDLNTLLA